MTQRRLPAPPPPSRHYPRRESSLSRIQRMADAYEPREPEEPEVDWDPGPFDPEAHRPIHAQKHHFLVNQRAAGMSPRDFDQDALRRGTAHEMEHTKDRRVAERIAMDHLAERPDYYDRLEACMPEQEPNNGEEQDVAREVWTKERSDLGLPPVCSLCGHSRWVYLKTPPIYFSCQRHGWLRKVDASEQKPNPSVDPIVETPEYRIVPARYSKGNMAVHVTRREDGMGTRAEFLARVIANGRYSNREGAYIMSPSAARRFHKLYQEGWRANFVSWDLISPTGEVQERKNKRRLSFNGQSDVDDYDPSAVESKLRFLESLAERAHATPQGSKAWSDDDFHALVSMGILTDRQVLAVKSANAYLERHYDRWMEEQGDEQARMQAYAEMGYENNPSSFYVWVLDDGDRPIEGPYGPFSKDTAKQYARIGAKQGRHDRAVTVGQSLDGEIMRIYEGGTGEKLVANSSVVKGYPIRRVIPLSILRREAAEADGSPDLDPADYTRLSPIIYEIADGSAVIVDGYHRAAGLVGWAEGEGLDLAGIMVEAIDVTGYDEDVVAAAADGFGGERQEQALSEILSSAR